MERGLISELDAQTIEQTLKLILDEFQDETIFTTEVGIFNGATSRGVHQYILSNSRKNEHTAIDSEKDKKVLPPFNECRLIIGNSIEVYNELEDNSQHFIFLDGNHSYPFVIADWYCYSKKVKIGGYLCFHDSGQHIKDFTDFQRMGKTYDRDMYISVRKAIKDIGLLDNKLENWKLIFDKADETDRAGGVCVFRKVA